METYHQQHLNKYCRTCSSKLDNKGLKTSTKKNVLKVKPAVKKFLFSNDSDNVDPEHICQICRRIIENINKEYQCPICSKNVKEKKTEKEKRHLVLFKKKYIFLNFELIEL